MAVIVLATVADGAHADLIAFWHFEEPSGSFVRDSVNGHHGTATADVLPSTDCPSLVPGNTYSRSFPGYYSAGGIFVPDHDELDLTGDFTIEMWAYRVEGGSTFIISKHRHTYNGDGSWGMEWAGPDQSQVQFNLYGPIVRVQSDPGVIPLEDWFHLALTYNEPTDRYDYYVNAQPAGGGAAGISGHVNNTGWPVGFGQIYAHPTCYGGMLDEIQIWNEYRTQTQIAQDMVAPVPAPGAVVLGVIGLGFANWRLRQRSEL